jgi:hypothetical protein
MQLLENVAENTNESVWQNLKNVIRQSSGFQHWQAVQAMNNDGMESSAVIAGDQDEEALVTSYLKETLQTLAY